MLEVIYSPIKAFKEIVKKPTIKGPLLIFLVVLLASGVAQYIIASKWVFEIGTPEEDEWTESTSLWTPTGISIDEVDKFRGNYSVASSVPNDTSVRMRISGIGPFNSSADQGQKTLSFRIKWVHQNKTFPSSNATVRLFSGGESRYFALDLVNLINASDTWANLTVNLGSSEQSWDPVNSPEWKNITGLEFELGWLASDAANLTMKIDDLYFGRNVIFLGTPRFTERFVESLATSAFSFFLGWSLYSVLLFFAIKLTGSEAGPWGVLFIVIGYTFSINMVQILVEAILASTFPPLVFPLKALNPIPGEERLANRLLDDIYQTNWGSTLAYNLILPLAFGFYAWAIALSAIAIRFLREFAWKKAAGVSITAYLIYIFIRGFLAI
ncbi:MAG: hypothetical protein JSV12_03095 [Candidatus Bathyarchaeota archaeon]|nr:MAG: hypothetical protein JSV12_03095 [Candidatus Bathyarchaeota archaeon]